MNHTIKQELHQLIDNCTDEYLLKEAKLLLKDEEVNWDELPEEERSILRESEAQYGRGEFITFAELMQRVDAKKLL